ncbi:hypothetical protein QKU48_gp1186 [Fadolivirus algeromassiliense]|jgi:hypothetical protein|uniref:Uncharacterized protein n=1 Tax=Fadolivirus FV1/VV64 TaxID=3070911 RepID=A0A7D3QVU4_9VIRU|nr:hypothetical protein QKU48_gp1186 [Fadolivirus algeromassiliense]QKF94644.1 hypothetical protein Fadolivirus_1_1186 [Fadolivirus FV1/VV64]
MESSQILPINKNEKIYNQESLFGSNIIVIDPTAQKYITDDNILQDSGTKIREANTGLEFNKVDLSKPKGRQHNIHHDNRRFVEIVDNGIKLKKNKISTNRITMKQTRRMEVDNVPDDEPKVPLNINKNVNRKIDKEKEEKMRESYWERYVVEKRKKEIEEEERERKRREEMIHVNRVGRNDKGKDVSLNKPLIYNRNKIPEPVSTFIVKSNQPQDELVKNMDDDRCLNVNPSTVKLIVKANPYIQVKTHKDNVYTHTKKPKHTIHNEKETESNNTSSDTSSLTTTESVQCDNNCNNVANVEEYDTYKNGVKNIKSVSHFVNNIEQKLPKYKFEKKTKKEKSQCENFPSESSSDQCDKWKDDCCCIEEDILNSTSACSTSARSTSSKPSCNPDSQYSHDIFESSGCSHSDSTQCNQDCDQHDNHCEEICEESSTLVHESVSSSKSSRSSSSSSSSHVQDYDSSYHDEGYTTHNCNDNINAMTHVCDHVKKVITYLKKVIDNITMTLTIICLLPCDGEQIQSILCETIELYDLILDELRCGNNSAVLTSFIPKFEKYKHLLEKIKDCKYDKVKANEILMIINKNQCQILKVLMVYQDNMFKRYIDNLSCD